MSIEAPNPIKFSPQRVAPPTESPTQSSCFKHLFDKASSTFSATPPESPQKNTQWLAYHGATTDKLPNTLKDMDNIRDHGLLKFSHITNQQQAPLHEVLKKLQTTPNVNHLIIRHSSLHHHNLRTISEVLKLNNGLAWLVLDHNKIDDKAVSHLANGIKESKGLKHLVLSNNHISTEGATALIDAISKNTHIKTLWLDHNQINNNSALQLINSLKGHPTLTTIDLRKNAISPPEGNIIRDRINAPMRVYI
jgi:hypothetical protein